MALTLTIELLNGRYDAARVDDRAHAEWPPHPARLFNAMVAAARGEDDRDVLRWLENQAPPFIDVAAPLMTYRHQAWVVSNKLESKGGSQTHPGRTNSFRARAGTIPTSPTVRMTWPVEVDDTQIAAIDAIARRIPYIGRSTGVAVVSASASGTTDDLGSDQTVRYEPCSLLEAEVPVRVPYPGLLAELDEQFEAGRPAWETSREHGYRTVGDRVAVPQRAGEIPSAYPDVVVMRFLQGFQPDGRMTTLLTSALRAAVLSAAGDDAPSALHGHGADGRPHVAFLALPHVGYEHSDGHLLGMAVAVPELPQDERRTVLQAVHRLRRENQTVQLRVGRLGTVELLWAPGEQRPFGASAERWRSGSKRWVSATPVVLDRYPKSAGRLEETICESVVMVGLPEPVDIQVSRGALQPGAVQLRPDDLPKRTRGRPYQHVALTFDRTVHGPVMVGAGRYLGVGLLAPDCSGVARTGVV
ncbi:MAG: type I-U CRISPR-associated protein Csb2 [Micrococcales bacterium]|nr:type I-U CRISPR-associated protein Csb2 [Micrococcales bacterium]